MVALASSVMSLQLSVLQAPFQLHKNPSPFFGLGLHFISKAEAQAHNLDIKLCHKRTLILVAATEGSAKKLSSDSKDGASENPSVPSWARPDSDEPPPWASQEAKKDSSSLEVPFYVYLLASAITAIAASVLNKNQVPTFILEPKVGSIFEYVNQKPVFGVLNSDSVFYAPLLGFFVFTGVPSSAFLWFKSVQVANKEAEEQDRRDGYL